MRNFGVTATAAAALLSLAAPAAAQDASDQDTAEDVIVVLGGLTPRPASEVGSAISVIDAEALDLRQINLVSDVLRATPGVAVNRTGPQGTLTQVRIRGAEGNQTLVFIDGVEANNPIFGEFNFANLVAADIDQIEVVRGAQSALYGSESIGGVIAVTTKTPEPGMQFDAEGEVGSFDTQRLFAAFGGGSEQVKLRGSVQHYTTGGISAAPPASETDGIGFDPVAEDGVVEDDGFENLTVSLKGVFDPVPSLRVETVLRYVDSEVDVDAQEFGFGTVQDALQSAEAEDLFAKIDATTAILDGAVMVRGFVGYTQSELVNLSGGTETSASEGERLDYGLRASTGLDYAGASHGLTLAVEREQLDFQNNSQFLSEPNIQDDEQTGVAAEYTMNWDDTLFFAAAVRQDFNDVFEDATTFRVSGAYLFDAFDARLHASWGEGITDPGFNERFGFNPNTFIGNPNLDPERSVGFDVGVEKQFFEGGVVVDVTYFQANLEDEISTSFTQDANGNFVSTPINTPGESDREGVEVTFDATLNPFFSLNGQYTYLDATGADDLIEVRRPEHVASVNLNWQGLAERATANLGIDYNGESEDLFFGFADPNFTPRVTLDAYTLVRVAGSYEIADGLDVFARVENALDDNYQEVFGFSSPGIGAYFGLRLNK